MGEDQDGFGRLGTVYLGQLYFRTRRACKRRPVDASRLVLVVLAVGVGGGIGTTLGSFRLPVRWARVLLSIVMSIAAVKLLVS